MRPYAAWQRDATWHRPLVHVHLTGSLLKTICRRLDAARGRTQLFEILCATSDTTRSAISTIYTRAPE